MLEFKTLHISLSRSAYRAEVASFVVPVAGEQASDSRLRERIDFTSNILFFIEDLYLALGSGPVTTKTGVKVNVASSLLWVRTQLAGNVKELMIAKKTGWQVLRNFKNQVFLIILFHIRFSSLSEPLEGLDSFDFLLDKNDSGFYPGFQNSSYFPFQICLSR